MKTNFFTNSHVIYIRDGEIHRFARAELGWPALVCSHISVLPGSFSSRKIFYLRSEDFTLGLRCASWVCS